MGMTLILKNLLQKLSVCFDTEHRLDPLTAELVGNCIFMGRHFKDIYSRFQKISAEVSKKS